MATATFRDLFLELQANIEKFVLGNSEAVRLSLICFLAQGHLLLEGVPGVAKTSLAKAIAGSVSGGELRRIQFTPDVLPTDITGVEIFNPRTLEFERRPGPGLHQCADRRRDQPSVAENASGVVAGHGRAVGDNRTAHAAAA
ncbi:AAA family ATPase [Kibdelosporangium aridum]|uniref:AAA family ATPase n=1 Tax=Kibdelosporangium aridum TaxID=2030 RepID=UPI0035EFE04E